MHITSISMRSFMSHSNTVVEIPPRGVVLVTGPNGAGKSSLPEAVSVGFWGKSLRGTDPWRDGEAGRLSVVADVASSVRTRKGGKTGLVWAQPGRDGTSYETATKSQEALESVIGPYDIWRRTHVFSSSDASHWTLATDSERKRLLEAVLGLDRFDPALIACRKDWHAAANTLTQAEQSLADARVHLEYAEQKVAGITEHLETSISTTVSVAAAEKECNRLLKLITAGEGEVLTLRTKRRKLETAGSQERAAMHETQRRLSSLGDGNCPTCDQAIPKKLTDSLHQQIGTQECELAEKQKTARAAMEEVDAQIDELQDEVLALQKRHITARATVQSAQESERRKRAVEADLSAANAALAKRRGKMEQADQLVQLVSKEAAVLAACEVVLGLKGVRAHVLGRALTGIESVANSWLARIASSELRLSLKPYSEKKSGGFNDSISLDVIGAGGGRGYKASSGGERRRIDVALLLSLAEVSAAAHGTTPGTLWFDEVFDALDDGGKEAVSEALADLATDRAVVVISHSDALKNQLRCAKHIQICPTKMKAITAEAALAV